jgi:hypothetical protein
LLFASRSLPSNGSTCHNTYQYENRHVIAFPFSLYFFVPLILYFLLPYSHSLLFAVRLTDLAPLFTYESCFGGDIFGRNILFQKWSFTIVMNYRTRIVKDPLCRTDTTSLLHM